ncbi:DUF2268 domain-containing putative Zn-dependent protease [Ensifer sp. 2YAB10]|jgi:uncharacterized protein YjaZ|uniref:DUF2268 domain-containing putative Zn-dependent protease n=1 Tax=unclassified Ensifer TaxID=2633371 RepID=UPI000DE2D503|nr:DUF2268 domain-containing putative Zn-dependent protease [Ensifer sp. SSB1]MBK5565766.1 hypothetical protein [Ensifer sp. SSB1]
MLDLRVHFLEAYGSLAPWREEVLRQVRDTAHRVGARVPAADSAAPIDIVVENRPGETIPEMGVAGSCHRRGLVCLTLDPDNENFPASLAAEEVRRMLTHELHHSFRHATCGYGSKLGEALVTEGLADAFEAEINGGDGHAWNHAIAAGDWAGLLERAERELWEDGYDHAGWFFGCDRALPRWAGYTIGYHLVKTYLAANPDACSSQMTATPASVVIGEAWAPLKEGLRAAA